MQLFSRSACVRQTLHLLVIGTVLPGRRAAPGHAAPAVPQAPVGHMDPQVPVVPVDPVDPVDRAVPVVRADRAGRMVLAAQAVAHMDHTVRAVVWYTKRLPSSHQHHHVQMANAPRQ